MPNNPNAEKNLRKLKKGETANPNGRPKKIINLITANPREEQLQIFSRIMAILQCSSVEEARDLVASQSSEKYGLILQLVADALTGPNPWGVLNDILDRLFGKPKLVTDNVVKQEEQGFIIRFDEPKSDIPK